MLSRLSILTLTLYMALPVELSASSWRENFMGWLGGEGSCEDASVNELNYLSCSISGSMTPLSPEDRDNIDDISEELLWQNLAQSGHEKSICEGQVLRPFVDNPQTQSQLLDLAYEEFQSMQEDLIVYKERIEYLQTRIDRATSEILSPYVFPDNLIKDVDGLQDYREEMEIAKEQLENVVSQMLSTLPLGEKPEVAAFYNRIWRHSADLSTSNFRSGFTSAIEGRLNFLRQSVEHYNGMRSGGSYRVSFNEKKDFLRSGAVGALVSGVETNGELAGLSCRLRAKYDVGPSRFDTGVTVGLVAASFVPGVGMVSAGVRAGAINSRLFSSASVIARAQTLTRTGVALSSVAHGASLVHEECMRETRLISPESDCRARNLVEDVRAEMNLSKCAVGAAFVALPLAHSVLPAARTFSRILSGGPQRPQILNGLEDAFRKSDNLLFFNGVRPNRLIRPRPAYLRQNELQPGNSYTVLVEGDQLVIGKRIMGQGSNPTVGGTGSHVTLRQAFNPSADPYNYLGKAGAIRINANGTIDVSGYHRGRIGHGAAELIERRIREIFPDARFGTVSGRRLDPSPE